MSMRLDQIALCFAAVLPFTIASTANAMRQYEPNHRRFVQRDSAGYGDGLNLHEYVRSSPTNFVDPSGEACTASWGQHCGSCRDSLMCAQDCMDYWCCVHDRCYGKAGSYDVFGFLRALYRGDIKECDEKICVGMYYCGAVNREAQAYRGLVYILFRCYRFLGTSGGSFQAPSPGTLGEYGCRICPPAV